MPPKKKFSGEQIIEAALAIAQEEGLSGITIRKVADRLGCSAAPIYVNFKDVEDLKQKVAFRISDILNKMIAERNTGSHFKDIGRASIRFAREYSVLCRELVLTRNDYLNLLEQGTTGDVIEEMKKDLELEDLRERDLKDLLFKLRTFQVGMTVMAANRMLPDDMTDGYMVEILENAASDFIAAARMRKKERKVEKNDS